MLARARCANHESRQASGQCGGCSRAFCRECLTEHDGRLTCAVCLRSIHETPRLRLGWRRRTLFPAMALVALFGSWLLFYLAGVLLEQWTAPPAARPPLAQRTVR
jgi:hypothetical protein